MQIVCSSGCHGASFADHLLKSKFLTLYNKDTEKGRRISLCPVYPVRSFTKQLTTKTGALMGYKLCAFSSFIGEGSRYSVITWFTKVDSVGGVIIRSFTAVSGVPQLYIIRTGAGPARPIPSRRDFLSPRVRLQKIYQTG